MRSGPLLTCALLFLVPATFASQPAPTPPETQYIVFNRAPGQGMNQANPESLGPPQFEEVLKVFPNLPGSRVRTAISFIFSPFRTSPEITTASLRRFLTSAERTHTPVLVQIDLEHWWEARTDLWNWWDPSRPGYDPANASNVEWTGWSATNAIKVAWRNWGTQIRVLPPPNLASPRYLDACRQEIRRLVPLVLDWYGKLPDPNKHLLIGIKLGHESSIGVNAYHYPNGNLRLGQPAREDPHRKLETDDVLARGMAQIGYAALFTSAVRTNGMPTEQDYFQVVHAYLNTLCREAANLGVPRRLLFSHGAGWHDGELVYDAAVNEFSCPGWSFYAHAADPRKDAGAQRNLRRTDAPFWAATEWLLQGSDSAAWGSALTNTLSDPRCRYLCIFNWEGIRSKDSIISAIRNFAR